MSEHETQHVVGGRAEADPGSVGARQVALITTIFFYVLIALSQLGGAGSQEQTARALIAESSERQAIEAFIERTRHEASASVLRVLMAMRERWGISEEILRSQAPARLPGIGIEHDLRSVVMAGELAGGGRALELLDAIEVDPSLEHADLFAQAIEALRRVYEGQTLRAQDRLVLRRVLGWWGELASAFDDAGAPLRSEAVAQGGRLLGVVAGVLAGGLIVFFASLVCLVWAIVLVRTGRLRPRFLPPTPGGSVYLEVFSVFLIAFLLLQVVGEVASQASPEIGEWVALAGQWTIVLVPAWAVVRGASWARVRRDLGLHTGSGIVREIGAGIFGYLAGLPIFVGALILTQILVMVVSSVRGEQVTPNNPVLDLVTSASGAQIVLMVSLVVLWAPLVEETVFRGALYRHVRARLGIAGGVLLVGVMFAFMHSYGVLFTPPLIALGVTFALLREWRGSLVASMTAHFVHNAALISLMLVFLRSA